MSTKRRVKAAIAKAGVAFEACWATLAAVRSKNSDDIRDPLVQFQPRLARAIHDLDKLHLEIKQRQRETISRKTTTYSRTFATRLRQFAYYDKVIDKTRQVGKTLGDAFAWFFYHREKELLEKHLKHKFVKHTPGGVGGKGELLFVENLQVSNGYLVLYHGITTMLRIGDVSFVELQTFRVVGLGEIKSFQVKPGLMTLRVQMIGTKPLESIYTPPWTTEERPQNVNDANPPEPTEKMKAQLQRQLETMVKAFEKQEEQSPTLLQSQSTRDSFVELCRVLETKSAACQKCGDGLLLVGVKPDPTESFSARMFAAVKGREKWDLGDFEKDVLTILDPTQDPKTGWNSIRVGVFSTIFLPGTTPFCWWQIDNMVTKRILFHELIVVTVYNPAFLVKRLQAAGFTVRRTGEQDEFNASKTFGKDKMEVPEWSYFIRLITDHFMSEEGVVQIVTATESRMVQDRVAPMTKVMIALNYYQ